MFSYSNAEISLFFMEQVEMKVLDFYMTTLVLRVVYWITLQRKQES